METGKRQPLQTYKALRKKDDRDADKLSMRLLLGLSQRKYQQVARQFTAGFGLRTSAVEASVRRAHGPLAGSF